MINKISKFFVNEKYFFGASKNLQNAHLGKAVAHHLNPKQTGRHCKRSKQQVWSARRVHLVGTGNDICRTQNALKTS